MAVPPHRTPLEGTTWSVWRDVALRSTGFPADMLLAICDDALARSADLDGQPEGGELAYGAAYAGAARRLSSAIAGIAADAGFREAVTWQNPGLAERVLDSDLDGQRRSKYRNREIVIASYLQRYCLKNDTIGFFGPVGWARVTPAVAGLDVVPGERLLARRTTHFEVWAIDKVAEAIARQGRVLGWLRPRRNPAAYIAGNVLHRPHGRPVTLTDAELRITEACDGNSTISEILAMVQARGDTVSPGDTPGNDGQEPPAGASEGRALLTRLARLGVLRLDLEGPVHAWPERLLRDRLEQIADPAARAAALAPLERMTKARDAVAATAGDAARLKQALTGLDEAFEDVTGSPATRRAGATYAGRTLVYTDAVRDVRVTLGAPVTQALARPLGLVLDSARWLVNEITAEYRKLFLDLVSQESARTGAAAVPLSRLLTLASPHVVTATQRTLTEIAAARVAEFQRRWQAVLDVPPSVPRHQVRAEAIAARVAESFPARPVAWNSAKQHSPDIMIAATSPDAVRRGDFLLVLGELHLANNTLEGRCFAEQHPDPATLIAAEGADHNARRVAVIPAKDAQVVTSRTSPPSVLLPADQVYWSAALNAATDPQPPATVMSAAELLVRREGDDLVVKRASSGTELDFFEVIGDVLSGVVCNAFQPITSAAHEPRITIDRLVLSRERWAIEVRRSQWAFVKDEQIRYLQARQWRAKHNLPERAFFRVPVEEKPVAVDFRSIVLVNLFAKLIRQTKADGFASYTVTEMLPDVDQLWLPDSAGRRYSSEFRFVAVDGIGNTEGASAPGQLPE